MHADSQILALHDKATRGQKLSAEEQGCLEQWYATQDQEESALLAGNSASKSLAELREQVNTSLAQLPVVIERIQSLAATNDGLRQEIAIFKQKLAQTLVSQDS